MTLIYGDIQTKTILLSTHVIDHEESVMGGLTGLTLKEVSRFIASAKAQIPARGLHPVVQVGIDANVTPPSMVPGLTGDAVFSLLRSHTTRMQTFFLT